ncbi:MAG: hypothetical protein [Caudoviricetes sp.]|nr:MAG: hypothetical protein [Caudoviricetes sp.]
MPNTKNSFGFDTLNESKVVEFQSSEQAASTSKKITARSIDPLGQYKLNELYGYKLISKANYIQLAIAHDFGVLIDPKLDSKACERFALKWSREEGDITASDMRKAIDKILVAVYKNEPENDKFPQLNLFE